MRLALVILAVDDVERASAFYGRITGWKRAVSVPVYAEFHAPGGMRLGVHERTAYAANTRSPAPAGPGAGHTTATELYFHVEDVDAAVAECVSAGARVLSPAAARAWGDVAAYCADPWGNVVVVARAA